MKPVFKHPSLVGSLALNLAVFVAVLVAVSVLAVATAGAEPPTHEIQKSAPRATVGVASTASVTVQGRNGWHVNQDAPITVTAKADPGVDLPKPKQGRHDLAQSSKESARFDIPFSATAAGKKTITAETRFVMCQEQACKPVKETVALEIDVAAASAAAPAPGANPAKKSKARPAPQ
jgi:hypothetical protein